MSLYFSNAKFCLSPKKGFANYQLGILTDWEIRKGKSERLGLPFLGIFSDWEFPLGIPTRLGISWEKKLASGNSRGIPFSLWEIGN
jgi:hypothetical protein